MNEGCFYWTCPECGHMLSATAALLIATERAHHLPYCERDVIRWVTKPDKPFVLKHWTEFGT